MSETNDEKMREALRRAVPPVTGPESHRDLWPEMLRRLEERPVRVPWFDWALAALLAALFFFFPEAIPVLLYHL